MTQRSRRPHPAWPALGMAAALAIAAGGWFHAAYEFVTWDRNAVRWHLVIRSRATSATSIFRWDGQGVRVTTVPGRYWMDY